MKKIGILSDTHGLLRDEVLSALQGCDAIIHGGDIDRQEVLDRLQEIAPVYVVRGNADKEWAEHIPVTLELKLFGLHIFMTHKKKDLPADIEGYDLVVTGHTHRYDHKVKDGTVLFNPGSCGPRRFNQDITLATLTADDDGSIKEIQRIDIAHGKPAPALPADRDIKHDIELVIRDIGRGRTVSEIAKAHHMDKALAEQICRLYLTHPGVDADGIMTKMGL